MQRVIQNGLDKTYNFEFEEAENFFKQVKNKYPQNPAYNFLMAVNTFWKILYLNKYKEQSDLYVFYLDAALKQTEKLFEKDPHSIEGSFFSMVIYSSFTLYHSRNKNNFKTLNTAKVTYDYMKKGFKLVEKFPDFYFSSGIYDFYVVQYPETNPFFKPFMWFFASGDKQRGIKELELASKQSVFMKTEATGYLANILLKYESKPHLALIHTEKLATKYPNNYFFLARHTEALVATGNYEEAEKHILTLYNSGQKFFEMTSCIFGAEVYEKYRQKLDAAKTFYQKAIQLATQVDVPTKDYLSFAYCGLARIADKQGNKKLAIENYELALKVAEYNSIKKEAHHYLNNPDNKTHIK